MKPYNILLTTIASSSLLLLAGCTTTTSNNTNVNAVVTTNENTNVVVADNNTNTEVGSDVDLSAEASAEVDTSDWLTYTNDEYGFRVQYPKKWVIEHYVDCFQLLSAETYQGRKEFLNKLKETSGGTDAGPRHEISICLADQNAEVSLFQWGEENAHGYVDEVQSGVSTLNELEAYMVEDLDFGRSKEFYIKKDNQIFSVYYEIFGSNKDDVVKAIVSSVVFY